MIIHNRWKLYVRLLSEVLAGAIGLIGVSGGHQGGRQILLRLLLPRFNSCSIQALTFVSKVHECTHTTRVAYINIPQAQGFVCMEPGEM